MMKGNGMNHYFGFLVTIGLALWLSCASWQQCNAWDGFEEQLNFPIPIDMSALYMPLEGSDRVEAFGNLLAGATNTRKVSLRIRRDLLANAYVVFGPTADGPFKESVIDEFISVLQQSRLHNVGIDLTAMSPNDGDAKRFAKVAKLTLVILNDDSSSLEFVKAAAGRKLRIANVKFLEPKPSALVLEELAAFKASLAYLRVDAQGCEDGTSLAHLIVAMAEFDNLVAADFLSMPSTLEAVSPLAGLKKLRWLEIAHPTVDGKACPPEALKKLLPGVDITFFKSL
jgi:hypothetical protein